MPTWILWARLNKPEETNSTLFYWTMIEAGIALIACCLPTLKPLVIGRRLSSVIASVRGVISLPSVRSQGSRNSKSWPTTHAANRIYTKMDKDTPVAIPLETMQSYGSRDPSGENVVGTTEPWEGSWLWRISALDGLASVKKLAIT